jgi:hypothetical protein
MPKPAEIVAALGDVIAIGVNKRSRVAPLPLGRSVV